MSKNTWMLPALLLAALIVSTALCGCVGATNETLPSETQMPSATEAQSIMAPDFTVVDAEGNEVKLSDFFGKPIVLNFWASWCGPCKSEMPDFNDVYLEQGEQVQFLMINLTDGTMETLEKVQSFILDSGYSFPVFYDVNSEAANAYGISAIPTTFFIAADGTLVAYGVSAISADALRRGISMITE